MADGWNVIRTAPADTSVPDGSGWKGYVEFLPPGVASGSGPFRIDQGGNVTSASGSGVLASGDTTGATDKATINAALALGAKVSLAPRNYYINGPLLPAAGSILSGAGTGTVIHQVSTTANGITATDISNWSCENLTLSGPGSGSGVGIRMNASGGPNVEGIIVRNVGLSGWGSHCIYGSVVIVSRFDRVICSNYLADAFHFDGVTNTSLSFTSCYADGTAQPGAGTGFALFNAVYCTLDACAADFNFWAYLLDTCQSVTLSGCGAEQQTDENFRLTGGKSCTLAGCWVYKNAKYGVHVTGSAAQVSIIGFMDNTPAGGATNSIITDTGSTSVVINPTVTTAASYGASTAYVITAAGGTAH